jgi:hypothetical protein
MQNVMIYFRNDPSVAFYEGCNSPLTAARLAQMVAVRDQWDPHGGRYMGALDINPAVPYEYGSPMDEVAQSTTRPTWSAEYSREEAPRRVWDKCSAAWDPHSMQSLSGGYVEIASPYYSAAASCPGGIEATAGNCICQYPLLDFRTNSMEDQALSNVYDYWAGYSLSQFVLSPSEATTKGIQIGASKIFFADSDSDGRMHDTEVARVSGVVDGSRLPKEAFYGMKVAASLTPDIALLGHWNYQSGTTKTVYVAASCGTGGTPPSTVTLDTYQADGATLLQSYQGAMDAQPTEANYGANLPNHYVWAFPSVAFQPGMIKAAATCGTTGRARSEGHDRPGGRAEADAGPRSAGVVRGWRRHRHDRRRGGRRRRPSRSYRRGERHVHVQRRRAVDWRLQQRRPIEQIQAQPLDRGWDKPSIREIHDDRGDVHGDRDAGGGYLRDDHVAVDRVSGRRDRVDASVVAEIPGDARGGADGDRRPELSLLAPHLATE